MATRSLKTTVLRLRQWVDSPAGGDDELVRRFARSRDEAAFAELVRRHGTLVLGVARRVLGEHHEAEDVLQATFFCWRASRGTCAGGAASPDGCTPRRTGWRARRAGDNCGDLRHSAP